MCEVSRRALVLHSLWLSLAALPCGRLRAAAISPAGADYYLARRADLTAAFAGVLEGAVPVWQRRYGAGAAEEMRREAEAGFAAELPGLPDVGGERNWDSTFIPLAAWYVALYGAVRRRGGTAEEVGRLVYDLNRDALAATPAAERSREGEALFSAQGLADKRAWAEWTQKRELPANWVATFIPGRSGEFDFGYDYSECGVLKYFRARGVAELAPFFCLNDFLTSAALATGLARVHTLAQGDPLCDFRYRRDRPVTQGWESEIDLIRARLRAG